MATPTPRPPFIWTQRLWRLVCPPRHQLACLRPEQLWALPRDGDDEENIRPIEIHGVPEGECYWERVTDRPAFLGDLDKKRLCLTVDAGVGKTTALKQTQYLRHLGNNTGLALWMDFADLPEDVDDFLGDGNGNSKLVRWLRKSPGMGGLDPGLALTLLRRRIRQGGLSLLVDALDQSRGSAHPRNSCLALRDLLNNSPEVRCVLTGRPFAIRRHWRDLFDPERFGEDAAWEFAMIDVFTGGEAAEYVGKEKMRLLRRIDAGVIGIPRSLEVIRGIAPGDLGTLRTKSDVYWTALDGMLQKALTNQGRGVGLPESNAWQLFALVAFEMTMGGFRAGQAGVKEGRACSAFLRQLWTARFREDEALRLDLEINNMGDLQRQLGRLCALNDYLADPVLEGTEDLGPRVVQLLWKNQTLQDMFSALWLTRYARPSDVAWLESERNNSAQRELWQLTAEMGKVAREDPVFATTVGAIYHCTPDVPTPASAGAPEPPPAPSAEWIYRSWRGMLECASPGCDLSTNERLREATTAWQREARGLVDAASSIEAARKSLRDAENPAREVLLGFLGEYPLIRKGARGREAQGVAEEFESSFRWVPEKETDSLAFWMGEGTSPRSTKIPGRFRLSRYPVTNELMGLWDPGHMGRASHYHKYSPAPRCPAIYVDWYTAWCVSVWLGGYLPTEEEWEYACRAQPLPGEATLESHPPQEFGFRKDDRKPEVGNYAWYSANSGRQTHPVGEKLSNDFGLCDMHGNVDEWCDSWFTVGVLRVARGGCWDFGAGGCRSAFRGRDVPSARSSILGFRVAQVPSGR